MPAHDAETRKLTLRGYRRADLPAMFRLDELCFAPRFRFSRSVMRRFAEAPNALAVLAEAGGQLAGFCIVHVEDQPQALRIGYVVTLDVAPQQRRQGLAGRLMREAESHAQAAGCGAMLLHVFAGNDAAMRFYERSSYQCVGEAKDFYGWGSHGLMYSKALNNPDL